MTSRMLRVVLVSVVLTGSEAGDARSRTEVAPSGGVTFTVSSTSDAPDSDTADGVCDDGTGACTLRAAIEQANAGAGGDTIAFAVGFGTVTITPASSLPAITQTLVIDGTTQPGYSGSPLIELDGSLAGAAANGLEILSPGGVVAALVVNRFAGSGLRLASSATGVRISGCFVGTDVSGTGALANGGEGILLDGAASTMIGGSTSQTRNVISGNAQNGVRISGTAAVGNLLFGNFIGTDSSGSAAIPNHLDGVRILGGTQNVVGGTAPGTRNVISGNTLNGVLIGLGATLNVVSGNLIGAKSSGNAPLGNLNGVHISGAAGNTIGGTSGAASNVISGNINSGVQITGGGSTGNVVQGNRIGTRADGVTSLANNGAGVAILATDLLDSPANNIVGGPVPGAGNVIASNGGVGILVTGEAAGQRLLANSIFGNAQLGIDLGADGPTPNDGDAGDADTGPNHLQDFPSFDSADIDPDGHMTVEYSVDSDPAHAAYPLTVEFFRSDATGTQGQTWLSSAVFTAADFVAGHAHADLGDSTALGINHDVTVGSGDRILATATDGGSNPANPMNTSEFSTAFEVNHAPGAEDDDAATQVGSSVTISVLENDSDADGSLDPDSLAVSRAPAHGTATPDTDGTSAAGTITYQPDAGFAGTDTFRYVVKDDDGALSREAVVSVDVRINTLPEARDDAATVKINTSRAIDVLANDSDPDGSLDATTVTIAVAPESGAAVTGGDGTVTYTPNTDFTGTDAFEYTVQDALGGASNQARVSITVNPNQAPVARDDAATTRVDADLQISVLANDSDPDGTLVAVSVAVVSAPQSGTATLSEDGVVTYAPDSGFHGDDTFSYTVEDDDGAPSNQATVRVTVNQLNEPPVAGNDRVTAEIDTALVISVLANDSDPDGSADALTVTSVTDPAHGSVAIEGGKAVSYTPDAGYLGSDFFLYTASDGEGGTDGGRVDLVVVRGPDLTGAWSGLAQICQGGRRCRLQGAYSLTNRGQMPAMGFTVRFFLSSDEVLDPGDIRLKIASVDALRAGRTRDLALYVKLGRGVDAAGSFVIASIDPADHVAENFEDNNVIVSEPIP